MINRDYDPYNNCSYWWSIPPFLPTRTSFSHTFGPQHSMTRPSLIAPHGGTPWLWQTSGDSTWCHHPGWATDQRWFGARRFGIRIGMPLRNNPFRGFQIYKPPTQTINFPLADLWWEKKNTAMTCGMIHLQNLEIESETLAFGNKKLQHLAAVVLNQTVKYLTLSVNFGLKCKLMGLMSIYFA